VNKTGLAAAPSAKTQAFSSEHLARRTVERRAVEAVIWGMPVVNYDLMYQAAVREAKGGFNQVIYWSRLPDWKIQTLTPNPDVIYLMPFINTKDVGPVVIEIPPADEGSITGTVMDVWQCALEDVGPAGVDKGKGGNYVVLPPGYKDKVPTGYIPLPSDTYEGYAHLRSIPKSSSEGDVANAVAYGKRVKLYPLSQAAKPPATTFVDVLDVVYDATITYDLRFVGGVKHVLKHTSVCAHGRATFRSGGWFARFQPGLALNRSGQQLDPTQPSLRSRTAIKIRFFELPYLLGAGCPIITSVIDCTPSRCPGSPACEPSFCVLP
jgi:hypothetical protein